MTARACNRYSSPSPGCTCTVNGCSPRPASTSRSRPRRDTPTTREPKRICSPSSAARGARYPAIHCSPVGYPVVGAVQPVGSRMRAPAASTSSGHSENNRTCPHSRTAAAGPYPASNTKTGTSRSTRCAAAASPCGPAPITTTGNVLSISLLQYASTNLDASRLVDVSTNVNTK